MNVLATDRCSVPNIKNSSTETFYEGPSQHRFTGEVTRLVRHGVYRLPLLLSRDDMYVRMLRENLPKYFVLSILPATAPRVKVRFAKLGQDELKAAKSACMCALLVKAMKGRHLLYRSYTTVPGRQYVLQPAGPSPEITLVAPR